MFSSEINLNLEKYHSIFEQVFSKCSVSFEDSYEDKFSLLWSDEAMSLQFRIDNEFWNTLKELDKEFLICHEILHVILHHGPRISKYKNKKLAIIAADLAVNSILKNLYKFKTSRLSFDIHEPAKFRMNENDSLENYYRYLLHSNKKSKSEDNNSFLNSVVGSDGNGKLTKFGGAEDFDQQNKIDAQLSGDSNTTNAADDFGDSLEGHFGKGRVGEPVTTGSHSFISKSKRVKVNPKWSKVLKKYTKIKDRETEDYQWQVTNRRFVAVSNDLLLPTINETKNNNKKNAYEVFLFLDTSGSCYHLIDIFEEAYQSFDKNVFDVKLFSRNVRVNPWKIGAKNNDLGGSDAFHCMEDYIQQELALGNIKRYPHAVFHFTDGEDCAMERKWQSNSPPQHPRRWYTFLTKHGNDSMLPREGHTYYLKDFGYNV